MNSNCPICGLKFYTEGHKIDCEPHNGFDITKLIPGPMELHKFNGICDPPNYYVYLGSEGNINININLGSEGEKGFMNSVFRKWGIKINTKYIIERFKIDNEWKSNRKTIFYLNYIKKINEYI